LFFFSLLIILRPPSSTLFPYTRSSDLEAHYLIINLTLVAVAFFVQSALIAEEREKNTLRGLMLSPATIPEILSGKSLVSLLMTLDRKSTRLNSSHVSISYAVFCLKKKT